MYIATEGCCHGELNKIYETLQLIESRENLKVELLLCCGDFQAVRNERDLMCMACPDKHKAMHDFWEYYNGKKTAPYLTIFIGGNHEASNYLQELPYGGWVAPNIYFMGYANVITYKGIRIGGLSGIFKQHDYSKGHYEKPPYTSQSMRSVYHIRHLEVFKLKQLKQPIDIMMSHDWPNGVVEHGDKSWLLARKRHFEEDVSKQQLGSLPAWTLLKQLRPRYWFSGHLHVKFAALIEHDLNDEETASSPNKNKTTRFLALDKCLPRRDFLQVIEVDTPEDVSDELCYDAEWLAVLKNTNELMSTSYKSFLLPTEGLSEKCDFNVDQQKINEVLEIFGQDLRIPLNFYKDDSCVYDPDNSAYHNSSSIECKINPQTTEFCAKLTVNDPIMMLMNSDSADVSFNSSSWLSEGQSEPPSNIVSNISINPDEIALDDSDDNDDASCHELSSRVMSNISINPEEIAIDDSDDNDNVCCEPSSHIVSNISINPEEIAIDDDSNDNNVACQQDGVVERTIKTNDVKVGASAQFCDGLKKSSSSESDKNPVKTQPRMAANFSLKLPAPKCSTPLPPTCELSEENRRSEELSSSFIEPVSIDADMKQSGDATGNDNCKIESTVKTFKRRNASIYSNSFHGDDTS